MTRPRWSATTRCATEQALFAAGQHRRRPGQRAARPDRGRHASVGELSDRHDRARRAGVGADRARPHGGRRGRRRPARPGGRGRLRSPPRGGGARRRTAASPLAGQVVTGPELPAAPPASAAAAAPGTRAAGAPAPSAGAAATVASPGRGGAMIRRGFWLAVGAPGGIMGYRRARARPPASATLSPPAPGATRAQANARRASGRRQRRPAAQRPGQARPVRGTVGSPRRASSAGTSGRAWTCIWFGIGPGEPLRLAQATRSRRPAAPPAVDALARPTAPR